MGQTINQLYAFDIATAAGHVGSMAFVSPQNSSV